MGDWLHELKSIGAVYVPVLVDHLEKYMILFYERLGKNTWMYGI